MHRSAGQRVRAVVFDIGGVLERVGPQTWADPWRERAGLSTPELARGLEALDAGGASALGRLSEDQFRDGVEELLRLSPREGEQALAAFWEWYCGELDEEMVAFARRLRPGTRTGILSNSADGARREEARRYGFPDLVDALVYSHEIGLAKPDPAAYLVVCDRLGVGPAECVFVDDTPAAVSGAAAVGMRAVLHDAATATATTISAVEDLLRA